MIALESQLLKVSDLLLQEECKAWEALEQERDRFRLVFGEDI